MKNRRKKHILLMLALAWSLVFTACGQAGAAESSAEDLPTQESPVIRAETDAATESQGDALSAQDQDAMVFGPDDFVPQEIACDNLFSSYRDGRENQEIQALYDAAGEQWEYLWYVEYDFDGDGEQDYIVLHDDPDKEKEENIGGGDVWIAKDFRHRIKLPQTTYLIGGAWEEPQLYMMLLTHTYGDWRYDDCTIPGFAVYQDYTRQEMALYGFDACYERARAVTIEEELEGVRIVETGFSLPYSDYDLVRLQITWDREEGHGYQVIMLGRALSPLEAGMRNCVAWDGNDDGYEDILYYVGNDGGSGGSWDYYYLLCWSEAEQRYESMWLPQCVFIDFEKHKLYSRGQLGVFHEYHELYGLREGEYRLEKRLDFLLWADEEDNMKVLYSEDGEFVEETDIPDDMDMEEIYAEIESKYLEFSYWKR